MKQSLCTVISNVEITPSVRLMWVESPDIAIAAQPGQFITVRCEDFTLRRPLSIHQASSNQIAILFKVVGKGTVWLSQRQRGDKLDILGPLGNGFNIEPVSKNLLLVAGGVGIAPLVFLTQHASAQHSITLIHGASTAAQLYKQSLLPEVRFVPVTEDSTAGRKGMAVDVLPDFLDWADQIYACGPIEMYKALADLTCYSEGAERLKNLTQDKPHRKSKLKRCQVSLEVRMGCGIGACYGCTINTKRGLKRVCRDGPVFELDDIMWEEVRI